MTHQPMTPLLTTTDWNQEWMELQRARKRADSSEFWDKKALDYGRKEGHSHYAEDFLALADLRPGEVVLDMGCGNGALAIPLAERGHYVIARDFSAGMLGHLQREAELKGLTHLVDAQILSWDDNWTTAGLTENSADVAFASRSIATSNLKDSLMRLNKVARRKACITLSTSASPRSDQRVLDALGLQAAVGRDYLYAFNILAQEGLSPSVNYILSEKDDTFATFQDAYESLSRMVADVSVNLSEGQRNAALKRLEAWLQEDLIAYVEDGQQRLRLSKPRCVTWGFISWNTRN